MRKTLFLLLSLAALGFAPAPVFREKPDDPESILRRLQGGWRGISYQNSGRTLYAGTPFRVHLKKDRWGFFFGEPSRQTSTYTITIDTKSKPMRIDWSEGGVRLKGIFDLSGDKLHYSYRLSGRGYPQSLAAPAPDDYVIEAEREK